MSIGHLDHVLLTIYNWMDHVTWKSPGPMCGWVSRILGPDSCISVSSWCKVPLLYIWSVAVPLCRHFCIVPVDDMVLSQWPIVSNLTLLLDVWVDTTVETGWMLIAVGFNVCVCCLYRACIQHQMMSRNECFFCKAKIEEVIDTKPDAGVKP